MFQEVKFYVTNSISYEMIEWAYNKVREPDCHYVIEIHYCEIDELKIYYIDGSETPREVFNYPYKASRERCISAWYGN